MTPLPANTRPTRFRDRRDAGRRLGDRLAILVPPMTVVLGLPRGGVVVAAEVAATLGAPLDVLVVRKLGCPWQPELGVGAIAEGGVRVLNDRLVAELRLSQADVEDVAEREGVELERRVAQYRHGGRPIDLGGRVAVIVDDGLATGYTARAAVEAARRRGASRVVLAVPVAPVDGAAELGRVADEVVALATNASFFAVGQFYDNFAQTTDEEVVRLLDRAAGLPSA